MGAHSRNKGRKFEQDVARDLREWLGEDWSVKRLRTDEQRGEDHAGEFAVRGPHRFPFAVECKAHRAFDVRQLWKVPVTGSFPAWWEQADRQAACSSRTPLLVISPHLGENLAVMRLATARLLSMDLAWPTMRVTLPSVDFDGVDRLVVCRWRDLMAINPLLLAELPASEVTP